MSKMNTNITHLSRKTNVDVSMRNGTRYTFDQEDKHFKNPLEVIKKDKVKNIEFLGGSQSRILGANDLRISVNHEHKLEKSTRDFYYKQAKSQRTKTRESFRIGWMQLDLTRVE